MGRDPATVRWLGGECDRGQGPLGAGGSMALTRPPVGDGDGVRVEQFE